MADQSAPANTAAADKGKGKGAAEPEEHDGMDVDSSSDEDADEVVDENEAAEENDEDNMETIDPGNIIPSGRRTRGVKIDFAKADKEMGPENDEDDLDDDFNAPESDAEMKDQQK
ncbi:unnamed protein product [Diplocarpon coronariae]|nr:hypothetical protein JHW43_001903 [Diplocarpon mali]